jgi:hypothetical protein
MGVPPVPLSTPLRVSSLAFGLGCHMPNSGIEQVVLENSRYLAVTLIEPNSARIFGRRLGNWSSTGVDGAPLSTMVVGAGPFVRTLPGRDDAPL